MLYKNTFPRFYSAKQDKSEPLWEKEFTAMDSQDLFLLLTALEDEYIKVQGDMDKLQQIGKLFITDCLNGRLESEEVLFDFLQFAAATLLSYYFVNMKVPGYMFDWIAHSITDSIEEEQERHFIIGRFSEFIFTRNPFIRQTFDEFFCKWTYCLFLYSRLYGGLKEMAQLYISHYLRYFLKTPMRGKVYLDYVMALCQLYTYTKQHNLPPALEKVAHYLTLAYEATEVPREWKKIIAIEFSCVNRDTMGKSKAQWCQTVLQKYEDLLIGHEKLQVLVNFYGKNVDLTLENLNQIEEATIQYRQFIRESSADKMLINYEYNEIYGLLFPAIVTLVKKPEHAATKRLIGIFFGISTKEIINDELLHIVPNDLEGIILSDTSSVSIVPRNPYVLVPELIRRTNEFLGTTNTLRDDLDFELVLPESPGIPKPSLGPSYEAFLNINFELKSQLTGEIMARLKGYALHFGSNLPIQPILLRQTGFTLPMIYSFQEPLQQRKFKKAYIWKGDSLYSDIECYGVKVILEKNGLQVDVMEGSSATIGDFVKAYECDDYDLIWISGHGDFQHLEPHKSFIQLFAGKELRIEDLSSLRNSWGGRRLIFLNICDGATTSLSNSPVSIGIGHYLVHKKQTLISHLWPVYPPAAMLLGWIIAALIRNETPYIEIFSEAIQLFSQGKEAILAYICDYTSELEVLERIENAEFDFSNFYYWGSLTLLQ